MHILTLKKLAGDVLVATRPERNFYQWRWCCMC